MTAAKVRKEIRDNPDKFDYADLPSGKTTKAQDDQADRMRPAWGNEMLAKENADK